MLFLQLGSIFARLQTGALALHVQDIAVFLLYFLFRGRFARFDLRTLGKRGLQLFLPGLRRGVLPGQLVLLGLQRLFQLSLQLGRLHAQRRQAL